MPLVYLPRELPVPASKAGWPARPCVGPSYSILFWRSDSERSEPDARLRTCPSRTFGLRTCPSRTLGHSDMSENVREHPRMSESPARTCPNLRRCRQNFAESSRIQFLAASQQNTSGVRMAGTRVSAPLLTRCASFASSGNNTAKLANEEPIAPSPAP